MSCCELPRQHHGGMDVTRFSPILKATERWQMCSESGTASLREFFPGQGLRIVWKVEGSEETHLKKQKENTTTQNTKLYGRSERERSVWVSRFRIDRFSENVFNKHYGKEGYFCHTLHGKREKNSGRSHWWNFGWDEHTRGRQGNEVRIMRPLTWSSLGTGKGERERETLARETKQCQTWWNWTLNPPSWVPCASHVLIRIPLKYSRL